jgi:hypothetical protein
MKDVRMQIKKQGENLRWEDEKDEKPKQTMIEIIEGEK